MKMMWWTMMLCVFAAGCSHEGTAGGDEHAGHATNNKSSGYIAEFAFESEPQVGVPVALRIVPRGPDGAVVKELQLSHERVSHLINVSGDLVRFEHVHPIQQDDGSLTITLTFVEGGEFTLFADYVPKVTGAVVLAEHRVMVKGATRTPEALVASSMVQESGNTRVTHTPPESLKAGTPALLSFEIEDVATGQPANDLQPYLGAAGHLVVLGEGATRFVHTHPTGDEHAAHGGMISPTIQFEATFPTSGKYKMWAQLQRDGQVIVAPLLWRSLTRVRGQGVSTPCPRTRVSYLKIYEIKC